MISDYALHVIQLLNNENFFDNRKMAFLYKISLVSPSYLSSHFYRIKFIVISCLMLVYFAFHGICVIYAINQLHLQFH